MAAKSKRIKNKLLWEAYTPVEADSDGYSDGVDFSAVVGNKRFHSFQVWRKNDGGRPTYVYGLTLKQIAAIRFHADEELISENAALKAQLEAAQKAFTELEQRALRPLLNRQTNNFTPRGNGSIRAIPIPMDGTPERRRKPKRR